MIAKFREERKGNINYELLIKNFELKNSMASPGQSQ